MKINHKQLIGLPVSTQSGKYLGRVIGFELEVETNQILKYEVRTGELFAKIFGEHLLISPTQVIKITTEEMIVEDTTDKEEIKEETKQSRMIRDTSPISMSK